MKILVLGNCQARPVSQLLGRATGAEMLEPVVLHLAQPEEAEAHRARMQAADLIVAQLTQDGFLPAHVASAEIRSRHADKTLIWPNLFYGGQQPWLRYVTHTRVGRILGPLDTYHDLRILGDWYKARAGRNPFPPVDPAEEARTALAELRAREAGCDLAISDLIEAEEARRPLFYTFNRPGNWLLLRLVQRICDRAGLTVRPFDPPAEEPLARIVPPSIWQRPESGLPFQGLVPDLSRAGILLPSQVERMDETRLRELSFACYDRQAEALRDHANLRLTPALPQTDRRIGQGPVTAHTARESILFETENLVCALHDRGSEHLVVTFGEMMFRPSGTDIWAGAPLSRLNLSALGFVARNPNWFPEHDMRLAINHLASSNALSAFRRRTGYGFSMGGYAVLKYGKALSLDRSIAVAPQISIDPQDIHDPRFNHRFDPDRNTGMAVTAQDVGPEAILLFDPHDRRDSEHAARIAALAPVTRIGMRNVGHSVVRALAGSDWLARLVGDWGKAGLSSLNQMLQERRRNSPQRAMMVALQASRKHKATALHIFKSQAGRSDPKLWPNVLLPLCQAGYGPQLQEELGIAAANTPNDPVLLLAQAVASQKSGNIPDALVLAQRAHEIRPGQFSAFLVSQLQAESASTAAVTTTPSAEKSVSPPSDGLSRNVMLYWADEPPPPSVLAVVDQWRDVFKDWRVSLYSRSTASAWLDHRCGPEIARLFRKCRLPAMQSDFFRVFWAIEEGGLYSDITYAPLVCPGFAAMGKELVVMRRYHGRIVNSIFYATKGSADLKKVAYHILKAMSLQSDENVWSVTGPGAWIAALGQEETSTLGIITDKKMYEDYVHRSKYESSTRGTGKHWSQDQLTASIYLS